MKQLTPIEELAEKCEIASIDPSVTIYLDSLDYGTTTEQKFIASVMELEQFRQAIISDFVSKLEPALHVTPNIAMDWDLAELTPLYALPDWIAK